MENHHITDIDYADLGRRIRKIRKERNWTQRNLADRIDKTVTHVSHIENGTTKISLPTIVSIANVFNTSIDRLLCDSIKNSGTEYSEEFIELTANCTPLEKRFIVEIARSSLEILRQTEKIRNNMSED